MGMETLLAMGDEEDDLKLEDFEAIEIPGIDSDIEEIQAMEEKEIDSEGERMEAMEDREAYASGFDVTELSAWVTVVVMVTLIMCQHSVVRFRRPRIIHDLAVAHVGSHQSEADRLVSPLL